MVCFNAGAMVAKRERIRGFFGGNGLSEMYFAAAPKFTESLVIAELKALGATSVRETRAGAYFRCDKPTLYRILLHARVISRVIQTIHEANVRNPDQLYRVAFKLPWDQYVKPTGTLWVNVSQKGGAKVHERFVAQRMKDAVVDGFLERGKYRPSVDRDNPDLRIDLLVEPEKVHIGIDLSGEGLHRRGYREEAGEAPLRENIAAAMLLRAGVNSLSKDISQVVDPVCGSGTLLIEAAMILTNTAPGLLRHDFGVMRIPDFDRKAWDKAVHEAKSMSEKGIASCRFQFRGYDVNGQVLKVAARNAKRAGLDSLIRFEKRELKRWPEVDTPAPAFVVANPPYGERLSELPELPHIYRDLGDVVRTHFSGGKAAVITGDGTLGRQLGMRAHKKHKIMNGPIACDLLLFDIPNQDEAVEIGLRPGAQMFVNRLVKNSKQLKKWLKKTGVTCYRLYDADMPEYNAAVDIYEDRVVLSEYKAPASISEEKAHMRLLDMVSALPSALNIEPSQVFLKERKRQKGKEQYRRRDDRKAVFEVTENGLKFEVNLSDYLDTGLFLDHRPIREWIRKWSPDKRFLNLFAYTGAASVYAAAGGAKFTTTVDMSNTYLDWAERNMALNGFDGDNHRFVRADCLHWLADQNDAYHLIFLDPPTFSNSKKMDQDWDVQRDHAPLLQSAAKRLKKDGLLIFSNNCRGFKLDTSALELSNLFFADISKWTIPADFERRSDIHQCFLVAKNQETLDYYLKEIKG